MKYSLRIGALFLEVIPFKRTSKPSLPSLLAFKLIITPCKSTLNSSKPKVHTFPVKVIAFPENLITFPEKAIAFPEKVVAFSEKAIRNFGKAIAFSGKVIRIFGKAIAFSGKVIRFSGKAITFTGKVCTSGFEGIKSDLEGVYFWKEGEAIYQKARPVLLNHKPLNLEFK
jgi:hypothetical protein